MKCQLVIRAGQKCTKIQQETRGVGTRRGTPSFKKRHYCASPKLANGNQRGFVQAAAGHHGTRPEECTPGAKGEGGGDLFAEDCPRGVPPQTKEHEGSAVLPSVAENVASISASFMVLYCLLPFPGSAYAGLAWRDDIVKLVWEAFHLDVIASSSLMLKYNTLGQAPALLHALPGAIWCALVPGQLAQAKRPTPGHAVRGRVMLTAAAVLMVGYALIDASGLTAEDYDYGGESGFIAEQIDRTAIMQQLGTTFDHLGLKFLAGWFILTGAMTALTARAGDLTSHRAWSVRHVGAGVWVAAQRPLFAAFRLGQVAFLGSNGQHDIAGTYAAEANAFYGAAYIVTFIYFLGAEAIAQKLWTEDGGHDSSTSLEG